MSRTHAVTLIQDESATDDCLNPGRLARLVRLARLARRPGVGANPGGWTPAVSGGLFTTRWISERHVLVRFDDADERSILRAWRAVGAAGFAELLEAVPGHDSVLLAFEAHRLGPMRESDVNNLCRRVMQVVRDAMDDPIGEPSLPPRLVHIPTCSCVLCAIDLPEVSVLTGLSQERVMTLFRDSMYVVRYIGFSPGFPYLSGLCGNLHLPRLAQPRPSVPPGSVAIAADQAGIYPTSTPGGWRLVGRTPVSLFEASSASPCLLVPGDVVRFTPIDHDRFEMLARGDA
ncbi:MAG: carboxyltransferase domain-containing protein [Phycisphaeraceae bacterium]|nr:carboxyltransferase domain-containing protein [Phycisphaerae bacterium]MBX3391769.1 carboxyltransferase domain-containing protein [Phycisphaeraceae bacterium]HRJ49177.1 carboxyltransferase domain-containing protein [Phycisphaerales bacterium]